jgi:hypothetical protein
MYVSEMSPEDPRASAAKTAGDAMGKAQAVLDDLNARLTHLEAQTAEPKYTIANDGQRRDA